jgi:hypothetical protein
LNRENIIVHQIHLIIRQKLQKGFIIFNPG